MSIRMIDIFIREINRCNQAKGQVTSINFGHKYVNHFDWHIYHKNYKYRNDIYYYVLSRFWASFVFINMNAQLAIWTC